MFFKTFERLCHFERFKEEAMRGLYEVRKGDTDGVFAHDEIFWKTCLKVNWNII